VRYKKKYNTVEIVPKYSRKPPKEVENRRKKEAK
jgi:hypothetical protein